MRMNRTKLLSLTPVLDIMLRKDSNLATILWGGAVIIEVSGKQIPPYKALCIAWSALFSAGSP